MQRVGLSLSSLGLLYAVCRPKPIFPGFCSCNNSQVEKLAQRAPNPNISGQCADGGHQDFDNIFPSSLKPALTSVLYAPSSPGSGDFLAGQLRAVLCPVCVGEYLHYDCRS